MPGSEKWSVVRPWKATYWKSFPKGVCLEYEVAPVTVGRYSECNALWHDAWRVCGHAEMQTFVPMKIRRTEPEVRSRRRVQFHSMGQRNRSQLLRALEHADSALQYAAAMRLVEMPDPSLTVILIDWFLKRRTRYALRVVSKIHDPRVLEALFEVFKTEARNEKMWYTLFRRDLRVAIGGSARKPWSSWRRFWTRSSRRRRLPFCELWEKPAAWMLARLFSDGSKCIRRIFRQRRACYAGKVERPTRGSSLSETHSQEGVLGGRVAGPLESS